MLRRFIKQVFTILRSISDLLRLKQTKDVDYVIAETMSYQCQFPSAKRVSDVLDGKLNAGDDPDWQTFGFSSKEEVTYWAPRACGAACIKMIADMNGSTDSLEDVIRKGVELGGYDTSSDTGWYYKPLLNLAKTYGYDGYIAGYAPISHVAVQLLEDRFVVASVNPQIIRSDKNITTTKKNGHLVLVYGVRIKNHRVVGFYIQNPSGRSKDTQENVFVPLQRFKDAYGQRAIVLS